MIDPRPLVAFLLDFIFPSAVGAVLVGAFVACSATGPACLVINAAHAACAVITVPDGKGGTEDVKVSREELVGAVQHVKAVRVQRELKRDDAGVP